MQRIAERVKDSKTDDLRVRQSILRFKNRGFIPRQRPYPIALGPFALGLLKTPLCLQWWAQGHNSSWHVFLGSLTIRGTSE